MKSSLIPMLTVLLASLLLISCSKTGRCDVEIIEGCTAQCQSKEGDTICTSALILSRSGSNAILQQKSKSVVIENIAKRCFKVSEDGTSIADAAAQDDLAKTCNTLLQKAETPPE